MSLALTDSQFEQLEERLTAAGLRHKALYQDLLDHYYCLTAANMQKGEAFDMAQQNAYNDLAPNGFSVIEQEVHIFLQFNFHLRMNRILYLGAFVATFGQTLYVLCRTLNWPGANSILLVACAALFLMVIPVWLIQFSQNYSIIPRLRKIRIIAGLVAISFFGLGSLFKLMYWPGANVQILLGTALLSLVFFPLFFWEQYKQASSLPAGIQPSVG